MTSESLKPFFDPRGVVVVGASREEEKPGHVIFRVLLENRKKGLLKAPVYGVNPKADYILGEKVFPSVKDIPGEVDLAVIVIPAEHVKRAIEDLGVKGIKAAIIISAGFSEIGRSDLEREVAETAKKHGIRIIGPNCIGVYSPWSGVDTIFLPYTKVLEDGREVLNAPRPSKGFVALISQSGAVGTAALDYMYGEGIGLSHFVSIGNKADVDEVELVEYLGGDDRTRVILLYLENIKRGREFIEVAGKVTLKKPVVVLKAGRTSAGRRAAASHTAALAGVDEVYDAAFRRSGVIRANDIEELFDYAKALAMQPPARGERIGIITDGGGAGVMATDIAEMLGLKVPELQGNARRELEELRERGIFPRYAQLSNPVDLTGSATSEMFVEATRILLESDEVDAVVVLALHQVPGIPDPVKLAREISRLAAGYAKPVVAVDTGWSEAAILERKEFDSMGVPSYPTPERAVKSLSALVRYGKYLSSRGALGRYLQEYLDFKRKNILQMHKNNST
ncbi:acetate--CoA ligase family protein [Thermofilum pendens]|uniref:CoA-binding domain protein n=1 Tax=Thermofilum pendens (strain DSM 2475 / Hrk 5) TaxID=368408 RepID=A1RX15_THEPD|nr:CoA-binding protein [Thermofilum pendens]ABL77745.1 CoA-binding domain protein [Thermofilum pendens Hrk 5]